MEGVGKVAGAEESKVERILECRLQEVQVTQEKVEQVKQEAIKASEAQFV